MNKLAYGSTRQHTIPIWVLLVKNPKLMPCTTTLLYLKPQNHVKFIELNNVLSINFQPCKKW